MKIALKNLEFIAPLLREIALDVEKHFGLEFTVTSLYRIGDNGVHGQLPLRGLDLRCKNDCLGYDIEKYVNKHYLYDTERPNKKSCIYHDVGQGKHIHLQVHNNSIRI